METTRFTIEELCCVDEERAIRKQIAAIGGIESVSFDFMNHRLVARHTGPRHELADAITSLGYTCRLERAPRAPESGWERYHVAFSTLCSGTLLAAGLTLHLSGVWDVATPYLFAASAIAGGWNVCAKAILALKRVSMDMNVLMTIASIGAFAIGSYEEGAAVMFLFAVSNWLERASLDRSKRRIGNLLELSPVTARKIQEGREEVYPVEEISPGDRLLIRPGERIPLDGTVVRGESTVDQSPVTGESRPQRKRGGDQVFAGSMNGLGAIEVEVVRRYADTTIARIVRLVEDAQTQRAPVQTFGETFAKYYTPAVVAGAILTSTVPPVFFGQPYGVWFYNALVMLVIACPCALVISTPVAIVSALANAARNGALVKGGKHLEAMGRIGAFAFDKTGTLTEGMAKVTDVIPLHSLSEKEILRLAAAIERQSEHHLAGALIREAEFDRTDGLDAVVAGFEAHAGRGVSARIDDDEYFIGNHALIEEKHMCSPAIENILTRLEAEGKTTIVLARNSDPVAVIAVSDSPRDASREVVEELRLAGVNNIIMLTGDEERTARRLAEELRIHEVYANLLPEEKMAKVAVLRKKYGSVGMIGDGINDAPALAASTVGIAMGTAGTDVAMETADIILMSDDLHKIPFLVTLGRKTIAIVKQNMAIALSTKLIFLTLALLGHASLWTAILADDGATLIVILNGLRTLRSGGVK